MERLFESITQKKVEVGETKENDVEIGEDKRPDWTLIGFQVISSFFFKFFSKTLFLQGLDPITDFRGGGLLSLEQLCFFAETNHEIIDKINQRANHIKTGYGLAITGNSFCFCSKREVPDF